MKLRIKGNSIRFRLSKSDLSKFQNQNKIEESTQFITGMLSYGIIADPTIQQMTANYNDHKITVSIPQDIADKWSKTQEVGIYENLRTADDKKLSIIIEKDFKCLDETVEDQSDNFENPLASKQK
jgi:hypothetical protein